MQEITADFVEQEIMRCTDVENGTGFLYFMKNYVKVPHPTRGSVPMDEYMYDWQKECALLFLKEKRIVSKKTRQVGFSTITQAYCLWRALFFERQKITVVSLGQRESSEFLEKLEFIYESLPYWLKTPTQQDQATRKKFKNGSIIKSLPNSPNAGRSDSLSLLVLDEVAEYGKNSKKIMAAASPALGPGFKTKFTNDSLPSQLFLISTWPEVAENNEYVRIYRNARDNPTESKYKIIHSSVHDNEFYSDPEWHEMMKEDLGMHAYNREVLGIEQTNLENPFIPQEILEKLIPKTPMRVNFLFPKDVDEEGYPDLNILSKTKDGYDEEFNYIEGLWIWSDPFKEKEYGVVCDVATGRSNDFNSAIVFDLETLEQVAEYKGKLNVIKFQKVIRNLAIYYNNARISVERNSMGEGICQWFVEGCADEGLEIWSNFYWETKGKRSKTLTPGHYTSPLSRGIMLASMQRLLIDDAFTLYSERLMSELKTFGFNSQGKATGIENNDDLVMAFAQFCYIRDRFFLTDRQIVGSMMYGDLLNKKEKEEEEKRKKHYLAKTFDMDPETEAMLQGYADAGYAVNMKELRDMAKTNMSMEEEFFNSMDD